VNHEQGEGDTFRFQGKVKLSHKKPVYQKEPEEKKPVTELRELTSKEVTKKNKGGEEEKVATYH